MANRLEIFSDAEAHTAKIILDNVEIKDVVGYTLVAKGNEPPVLHLDVRVLKEIAVQL